MTVVGIFIIVIALASAAVVVIFTTCKVRRTTSDAEKQKSLVLCMLALGLVAVAVNQYGVTIENDKLQQDLDEATRRIAEYEASDAELLPCPFCGSTNIKIEETAGTYYVQCQDCYSTSGWSKEGTKQYAVEAWNSAERKSDE